VKRRMAGGRLEYHNGKLIYIDRYRSNIIKEYEYLYDEYIIKNKEIKKDEGKRLKIKIEKDYQNIQSEYGSVFIEIDYKMKKIYKICYYMEKREDDIKKMVKNIINQGIYEYERKKKEVSKTKIKRVRFDIERK
jgi:hypothetical protein